MKKFVFAVSVFVSSLMILSSGTAQTQPPVLTIRPIPAVELSFQGTPGTSYTLQSTANVADTNAWQYVATFLASSSGMYSYDAFANGPALFYRTVAIVPGPAVATILLDPATPLTESVPVNNPSQGQYLSLPVLAFDVFASGDNEHLRQLTVNVGIAGQGSVNAAYLYNGSVQVSSAPVSGGVAVFQNIVDGTLGTAIPINASVAFTVKVDVAGLTGQSSSETVQASVFASNAVVLNSEDVPVTTVTGNAIGNPQTVLGMGAAFSLAGAPTIVKNNITAGGATNTTYQYTATFNVNVLAVGEPVDMGMQLDPPFAAFQTNSPYVAIYKNGVAVDPASYDLTVSYEPPSGVIVFNPPYGFRIVQNQTVPVPVTYTFTVTNPGANVYAVELETIGWLDIYGTFYTTDVGDSGGWTTLSE